MALASMNLTDVKEQASAHAETYFYLLDSGELTLSHAHNVLKENRLGLFQTAGLVMAVACFQCVKPETAVTETNVIKVDEDNEADEIRVYDATGEISNTFDGGSKMMRRGCAEEFATREAARLGIRAIRNY